LQLELSAADMSIAKTEKAEHDDHHLATITKLSASMSEKAALKHCPKN